MPSLVKNIARERLTLPKDYAKLDSHLNQEQRSEGVPQGDYRLPMWQRLPLDCKLFMCKGPVEPLQLSMKGLGERVQSRSFDEYVAYNDPALKQYFSAEKRRKHLTELGILSPSGQVICSLRQYNRYRNHIRGLCVESLEHGRLKNLEELHREAVKRCQSAPDSRYGLRLERVRQRVQELEELRQERNEEIMRSHHLKGQWYRDLLQERALRQREKQRSIEDKLILCQPQYSEMEHKIEYLKQKEQEDLARQERRNKLVEKESRQRIQKKDEFWQAKIEFQQKQLEIDDKKRAELQRLHESNVELRKKQSEELWKKQRVALCGRKNRWRYQKNRYERKCTKRLVAKLSKIKGLNYVQTLQQSSHLLSGMSVKHRFQSLWVLEEVLRNLSVPQLTGNQLLKYMKKVIKEADVGSGDWVELDDAVSDLVLMSYSNIKQVMSEPIWNCVDNGMKSEIATSLTGVVYLLTDSQLDGDDLEIKEIVADSLKRIIHAAESCQLNEMEGEVKEDISVALKNIIQITSDMNIDNLDENVQNMIIDCLKNVKVLFDSDGDTVVSKAADRLVQGILKHLSNVELDVGIPEISLSEQSIATKADVVVIKTINEIDNILGEISHEKTAGSEVDRYMHTFNILTGDEASIKESLINLLSDTTHNVLSTCELQELMHYVIQTFTIQQDSSDLNKTNINLHFTESKITLASNVAESKSETTKTQEYSVSTNTSSRISLLSPDFSLKDYPASSILNFEKDSLENIVKYLFYQIENYVKNSVLKRQTSTTLNGPVTLDVSQESLVKCILDNRQKIGDTSQTTKSDQMSHDEIFREYIVQTFVQKSLENLKRCEILENETDTTSLTGSHDGGDESFVKVILKHILDGVRHIYLLGDDVLSDTNNHIGIVRNNLQQVQLHIQDIKVDNAEGKTPSEMHLLKNDDNDIGSQVSELNIAISKVQDLVLNALYKIPHYDFSGCDDYSLIEDIENLFESEVIKNIIIKILNIILRKVTSNLAEVSNMDELIELREFVESSNVDVVAIVCCKIFYILDYMNRGMHHDILNTIGEELISSFCTLDMCETCELKSHLISFRKSCEQIDKTEDSSDQWHDLAVMVFKFYGQYVAEYDLDDKSSDVIKYLLNLSILVKYDIFSSNELLVLAHEAATVFDGIIPFGAEKSVSEQNLVSKLEKTTDYLKNSSDKALIYSLVNGVLNTSFQKHNSEGTSDLITIKGNYLSLINCAINCLLKASCDDNDMQKAHHTVVNTLQLNNLIGIECLSELSTALKSIEVSSLEDISRVILKLLQSVIDKVITISIQSNMCFTNCDIIENLMQELFTVIIRKDDSSDESKTHSETSIKSVKYISEVVKQSLPLLSECTSVDGDICPAHSKVSESNVCHVTSKVSDNNISLANAKVANSNIVPKSSKESDSNYSLKASKVSNSNSNICYGSSKVSESYIVPGNSKATISNICPESYKMSCTNVNDGSLKSADTEDDTELMLILTSALKKILSDVQSHQCSGDQFDSLQEALCEWWSVACISPPIQYNKNVGHSVADIFSEMLLALRYRLASSPRQNARFCEMQIEHIATLIEDSLHSLSRCDSNHAYELVDNIYSQIVAKLSSDNTEVNEDFADALMASIVQRLRCLYLMSDEDLKTKQFLHKTLDIITSDNSNNIENQKYDSILKRAFQGNSSNVINEEDPNSRESLLHKASTETKALYNNFINKVASSSMVQGSIDMQKLALMMKCVKAVVINFLNEASDRSLSVYKINEIATMCAVDICRYCYKQGMELAQSAPSIITLVPSSLENIAPTDNRISHENLLTNIKTALSETEMALNAIDCRTNDQSMALHRSTFEDLSENMTPQKPISEIVRRTLSAYTYGLNFNVNDKLIIEFADNLLFKHFKCQDKQGSVEKLLEIPSVEQTEAGIINETIGNRNATNSDNVTIEIKPSQDNPLIAGNSDDINNQALLAIQCYTLYCSLVNDSGVKSDQIQDLKELRKNLKNLLESVTAALDINQTSGAIDSKSDKNPYTPITNDNNNTSLEANNNHPLRLLLKKFISTSTVNQESNLSNRFNKKNLIAISKDQGLADKMTLYSRETHSDVTISELLFSSSSSSMHPKDAGILCTNKQVSVKNIKNTQVSKIKNQLEPHKTITKLESKTLEDSKNYHHSKYQLKRSEDISGQMALSNIKIRGSQPQKVCAKSENESISGDQSKITVNKLTKRDILTAKYRPTHSQKSKIKTSPNISQKSKIKTLPNLSPYLVKSSHVYHDNRMNRLPQPSYAVATRKPNANNNNMSADMRPLDQSRKTRSFYCTKHQEFNSSNDSVIRSYISCKKQASSRTALLLSARYEGVSSSNKMSNKSMASVPDMPCKYSGVKKAKFRLISNEKRKVANSSSLLSNKTIPSRETSCNCLPEIEIDLPFDKFPSDPVTYLEIMKNSPSSSPLNCNSCWINTEKTVAFGLSNPVREDGICFPHGNIQETFSATMLFPNYRRFKKLKVDHVSLYFRSVMIPLSTIHTNNIVYLIELWPKTYINPLYTRDYLPYLVNNTPTTNLHDLKFIASCHNEIYNVGDCNIYVSQKPGCRATVCTQSSYDRVHVDQTIFTAIIAPVRHENLE